MLAQSAAPPQRAAALSLLSNMISCQSKLGDWELLRQDLGDMKVPRIPDFLIQFSLSLTRHEALIVGSGRPMIYCEVPILVRQDSLLCVYLYTLTITHSHTMLITCTCYDLTKGTQDKDFSHSFSILSH